jgi:L-fuculose-phosphate aldolase
MCLKGSIIMIAENHDLRKEVLQACRGLGLYGLGSGIGGHVSARYPDEPYFYINTFDRTFEEMQIEDIILVDFKGNAVNSSRSPSVGIDFHYAIYNQRPDVRAVVHSHGFWITAQAAYCRPPRIFNNVSAVFYERTAISSNDDFHSIGEAIGESDIAIVIPWHGAITVGGNVGEAVSRHVVFDYTARLDVTLPAHTPTMPHEQCAHFREVVTKADYYNETWKLIKRKADAS